MGLQKQCREREERERASPAPVDDAEVVEVSHRLAELLEDGARLVLRHVVLLQDLEEELLRGDGSVFKYGLLR